MLAFWQTRLAGAPPVLDLYTDRPRRDRSGVREETHRFTLGPELGAALLDEEEVPGTIGLSAAALAVLLRRYTGQEEVVLGTLDPSGAPVALRVDLSDDPTGNDLRKQVQQTILEAYDHGGFDLDAVVDALHIEREAGRHPLFQVMVVPEGAGGGLAQGLDLCFSLRRQDGDVVGEILYEAQLFDRDTVGRMATHFVGFLRAVVTGTDEQVTDLPLLTETDRELLRSWAGIRVPYPERCLHQLIEDQVERTPDAVALEFEDQRITYREMNERANRLAHHLRARGVGPEVLVGLSLERSPELIVGILGILKAGGAYLPLDPDYPIERLEFMLEDARVSILVTQASLRGQLPHTGEIVLLDEDGDAIAAQPADNPDSGVTLDNLIYVMYTSGSTGKPKGVVVTHRGVASLSEAGTPSLLEQPGHKVLQFHSPSFDPSVFEIYLSLPRGKTLVLARREDLMPGPSLAKLLAEHEVECLAMPASALAAVPFEPLPKLKMIFVEGETPSQEVVAKWAEGRKVFNTYGPTEASMWCIGSYLDGTEWPVPIGRPVANEEAWILDGNLRQVPPGVTGELYIGGVGLARGYLRRPELTEQKFVPHPFDDEPGARLYRTGDLARYRSDGTIDFLGRTDDQVKVRGFRVELGEVETVLMQHPGVREAVVVARADDRIGHKRLVAYVTLTEEAPSQTTLRAFVKERLPDYMVPAAFVVLDRFPMTPNGKLDRRALPAPDDARPELDEEFVEAASATQEVLTGIWCEVLGLETVGVKDNFFDLGGDSLLAILVVSEIESAFGVTLAIDQLLEHTPTIEQLAAHLDDVAVPS
jgi:amino acid adenylation domain-containing protein